MNKYAPLRDYLQRQSFREFILSFQEIEEILGYRLPVSADRPQWWANTRSTEQSAVQREAWRAAGYDAFLIPPAKVRFQKVKAPNVGDSLGLGLSRAQVSDIAPAHTAMASKKHLDVVDLLAAGFCYSAKWKLSSNGELEVDGTVPTAAGVYAFAKDSVVHYVGVATMGLAKRLYFYGRPGPRQLTNVRINGILKTELKSAFGIEIYTATPADTEWNGLPVNMAAGLELGLIRKYALKWNMRSAS